MEGILSGELMMEKIINRITNYKRDLILRPHLNNYASIFINHQNEKMLNFVTNCLSPEHFSISQNIFSNEPVN